MIKYLQQYVKCDTVRHSNGDFLKWRNFPIRSAADTSQSLGDIPCLREDKAGQNVDKSLSRFR